MQNAKNPLIFIIEDNPIYNELITGVLRSKKFKNIHSFKSAEECLRKIDQNPDIVILDYSFTGINGLELMRRVHETKPAADFIFLSAQNDVEIAVKIVKLGAFDYIVKNEKAPEKLLKSINDAISVTKKVNLKKGMKKGVVLFFVLLTIIIMIIFSLTIFVEDFRF